MSDREDRLSIEQKGWARLVESRVSRRTLIRGGALGAAGLTAAALIGCGDDDDDDGGAAAPATAAPTQAAAPATAAAATAAATAAAEPDYVRLAREDGAAYPYSYEEPDTPPKPGGILRLAVQWGLGTWDPNFPSGGHGQNVANVAANRLLGLVDGPEMSKFEIGIEPELAKTWEVSPDGPDVHLPPQRGRALPQHRTRQRARAGGAGRQAGLRPSGPPRASTRRSSTSSTESPYPTTAPSRSRCTRRTRTS